MKWDNSNRKIWSPNRLFMFVLSVLISCESQKAAIDESYDAIAFTGNGDEIHLSKELYMRRHEITYILFRYHDTLFQAEISKNATSYSFLKNDGVLMDSLKTNLSFYRNTNLKKQIKEVVHNGELVSCSPDGYFLFNSKDKLNFGKYDYREWSDLLHRKNFQKIKLPEHSFPKVYSAIYHTFNSKIWDYTMSKDYQYKSVRTYNKIQLLDSVE